MGKLLARVVVIVAVLCTLPGCSLLFSRRVPDDYARRPTFTCTTNRAVPALDLGLGVFYTFLGTTLLIVARSFGNDETAPLSLLFFAPAAGEGISAFYGFSANNDCDDAMDAMNASFIESYNARALNQQLPQPAPTTLQHEPERCGYDTQCSDARLCLMNRCADPPTPTQPTP